MSRHRFTGEAETYFPSLGLTLKPGQTVEISGKVDHPHLKKIAAEKPATSKVRKPTTAAAAPPADPEPAGDTAAQEA